MSTNSQSILTTVKRTLNLEEDYTYFDYEITTHINSAFGTLHQLGIGPVNGFEIEDATAIWSDFMAEDLTLSPVKSYVYLYVKLLFDPPAQSWVLTAQEQRLDELTWRLNVVREDALIPTSPEETIIDGGGP